MYAFKYTIVATIATLMTSASAQSMHAQLYINECYGNVVGDQGPAGTGPGQDTCLAFPSQDAPHFVDVVDACGIGYCAQVEFFKTGNTDCSGNPDGYGGNSVFVGNGCYNINLGFEPAFWAFGCTLCGN